MVSIVSPRRDHPVLFLALLPLDLYREFLKYLDLDDLGRLDLALLNHQMREVYLTALAGTVLPEVNDDLILCWLSQRNMFAKKILLSRSDDLMLTELISHLKPALESLDLYKIDLWVMATTLLEIGSCPKLRHLSFNFCHGFPLREKLENFLQKNPQLESFAIVSAPQLSNEILEVILASCPHLKHLSLSASWVSDASLDLISKRSPVTLRSLSLPDCKFSEVKIRDFIKNSLPPSLRYLSVERCSPELVLSIFQKLTLPSIMQELDQEVQLLGLRSLRKIFGVVMNNSSETVVDQLLQLLIQFLSPQYDHRFHVLALQSLVEYSSQVDAHLPTELLPSLLPFLSPGTTEETETEEEEEEMRGDAMQLIFFLVDLEDAVGGGDAVCQFLYSNCLIPLILNPESQFYSLARILSKGTIPQLTEAFSALLSTPRSRLKAAFPFSLILTDVNLSSDVWQAIQNSNLLEHLFEDLLAMARGSDTNSNGSLSPVAQAACRDPRVEETYLETIVAYCKNCSLVCDLPPSSLLQPFISHLPSLKLNHQRVLLRCLQKIMMASPTLPATVPSELAPMLFSLEISEEVVSCVMAITEPSLSLGDLEFLQRLVDSGLLLFLTSALKSRLKFDLISADSVMELLHLVMRSDERYVEIVASLGLPRALNRTVMKGFI